MRSSLLRLVRTDYKEWVRKTRAYSPALVEIGKKPPKLVLSFGGAGFLVTYSLGVAKFLQEERKELLSQSFLLGAGTGVIPAVALACGGSQVNIDNVVSNICDNLFSVLNEPKRREVSYKLLDKLLPPASLSPVPGVAGGCAEGVVSLINGRVALTIGFSNRDEGYLLQKKPNIYYGHHVSSFDSRDDLISCMIAAMAPNVSQPMRFRDADNVVRGTFWTISSELDQLIRHVHVHGYCGYKFNRHQTRHNFHFGRHGFLANTNFSFTRQVCLAFFPSNVFLNGIGKDGKSRARDKLLAAFEHGYIDAKRYERWEEDPYYYAKPDRSSDDEFNWRSIRASIFGGRKSDKFEL